MDWQHPALQEMLRMGCSDSASVMFSFQSYMKLCEVDVLFDVGYAYDAQLDVIYLTSTDGAERSVHLPVAEGRLNPSWLHSAQLRLRQAHPNSTINMLLKTPDTTILPYKLSEGLCPPPESSKDKKIQQEKAHYIKSELNKRKAELYKEAKQRATKTEQMDADTEAMVKSEES